MVWVGLSVVCAIQGFGLRRAMTTGGVLTCHVWNVYRRGLGVSAVARGILNVEASSVWRGVTVVHVDQVQ